MTALAVFGGFVGVVILMVFSAICNGYALSILWGWFVVPVFGLPQLTVVSAIGIAMIVSYLTREIDGEKNKDKGFGAKMLEGTIVAVLKPSFALLFGYIVHSFM